MVRDLRRVGLRVEIATGKLSKGSPQQPYARKKRSQAMVDIRGQA